MNCICDTIGPSPTIVHMHNYHISNVTGSVVAGVQPKQMTTTHLAEVIFLLYMHK